MLNWITPYLSASVISVSLAAVFAVQFYRRKSCYALTLAALFNSFWLFSLTPSTSGLSMPNDLDLFFECMHYSIWVLAISRALPEATSSKNLNTVKLIFWLCWAITFTVFLILYSGQSLTPTTGSLIALSLSICTIWCVEVLFRSSIYDRQIKIICVSIGILLFYDLFYHTYSIFNDEGYDISVHIRASVYLAACFIMAIGIAAIPNDGSAQKIKLSHNAAFYSSTIISSALFLTLILFGAYYLYDLSGSWTTTTLIFITFAAMFCIVILYSSKQLKSKIIVLINKNFFSHMYDYREEWLKISNLLSQETTESPNELVLNIITKTFNCDSGILWVREGNYFVPKCNTTNQTDINLLVEPIDSDFISCLSEKDWIFYPYANENEQLGNFNERLPKWAFLIRNIWIVAPLLTNNELVGFVSMTHKANKKPTWEDLDLLRAIGSQLAAHIKLHIQEKRLEEQIQLNVYNKLSSFVMHDLNNLIAQQDLVVKNADKHINNPAFVADAISTVSNSVNRMKDLLFKLRNNKPDDWEKINLISIIEQALTHNRTGSPIPTFDYFDSDMIIKADRERLMMSISHLIKNAQDATPDDGNITIELNKSEGLAELKIRDTGAGMTTEFIREKLFKPFESTKSGSGMGIGVYLTRDYVEQLGGSLFVSSAPNLGTCFTIKLRLLEQ